MKIGLLSVLAGAFLYGCSYDSPTADVDPGLDKKLPIETAVEANENDTLPQINIRLGKLEQVSMNEQPFDLDELQAAYDAEHDRLGNDVIVHFYVHKYESYGSFSAVHGVIENYNKSARFKESRKRFNTHYDKLTPRRRNIINHTHMIRMVEHKIE